MPQPKVVDLLNHKPGDVIDQPEGRYTVNPDGLTTSFVAKPTTASSSPQVPVATEGTSLEKLQANRNALEAHLNEIIGDPAKAVEATTTRAEIDKLNGQIAGASRPTDVRRGGTLVDANGNVIATGQPAQVSSGASIYDPSNPKADANGFVTAPKVAPQSSPSQLTEAGAAAANAQAANTNAAANTLQAQTAAAAQRLKEITTGPGSPEWKKAQIDLAIQQYVTIPIQVQAADIARATFAENAGNNAATRSMDVAKLAEGPGAGDLYAQVANKYGGLNVTRDAFARPLPDPNAVARAATMNALKDISPTAQAMYTAGAQGIAAGTLGTGPATPPPAGTAAPASTGTAPASPPAAPAGVDPAVWAAFQKYQQAPAPAAAG